MVDREVSTIAFYDEDMRILMQDRREISKFGEEWGFFGGSLEEGENPRTALKREIVEELEFNLEDFEFMKSYLDKIPIGNGLLCLEHVHLAKFPGFKALNQKEGSDMKLFTITEAKKLKTVPIYRQVLDDIEKFLANK